MFMEGGGDYKPLFHHPQYGSERFSQQEIVANMKMATLES